MSASKRTARAEERMLWLLRLIAGFRHRGGLVAWDEDVVDEFVEAFPESQRTLRVYLMGPHSCPMLNRAAGRARDRGFLKAWRVGNMDARSFNQRTWCRYWTLTEAGKAAIEASAESASAQSKGDQHG